MTSRMPDSARLIWVNDFVAFAAYDNSNKASLFVDKAATTIQRSIKSLERWLRRMLITDDKPAELIHDGYDFVDIALEILCLADKAGIRSEMTKVRILPDGTVKVDGCKINSAPANKIGRLMANYRALIGLPYVRPHVASSDINMEWWSRRIENDFKLGLLSGSSRIVSVNQQLSGMPC